MVNRNRKAVKQDNAPLQTLMPSAISSEPSSFGQPQSSTVRPLVENTGLQIVFDLYVFFHILDPTVKSQTPDRPVRKLLAGWFRTPGLMFDTSALKLPRKKTTMKKPCMTFGKLFLQS